MSATKSMRAFLGVFMLIITILWLGPIFVSFFGAFTESKALTSTDVILVFTWDNFKQAIEVPHLGRYILNTIIITFSSVVLITIISSTAAFSMSRLRFKGRKFIYAILLMTLMIPQTSLAIPIFFINKTFHLFNNYLALILPYTALGIPFSLIILKNFFDQFPKEVEEAAIMDGASPLRVFSQILFPNSLSSVSIVVIWAFMQSWNEFLFATLFMTDNSMKTLAMAPVIFQSVYETQVGGLLAFLILSSIPVIVAYLSLQRYFERGLTSGAVKG